MGTDSTRHSGTGSCTGPNGRGQDEGRQTGTDMGADTWSAGEDAWQPGRTYRQQTFGIEPGRLQECAPDWTTNRSRRRTWGQNSSRQTYGQTYGQSFGQSFARDQEHARYSRRAAGQTDSGRSARYPQGAGRDWEQDSLRTQPWSAPIVVVSRLVPGLCYGGRINNWDFHVIFSHLARAAGAEGTQLYRNLSARLLPGWQIWKETFPSSRGRISLDCLTFAGARAFLKGLEDCPLGREHRALLPRLQEAFADSLPEGDLYPVPLGFPWDIHVLQAPPLPLRAIIADKVLVPVLLKDGTTWLAIGMLCYWYRLHTYSLQDFERTARARCFDLRHWFVPGLNVRAQTYVPLDAAPDCLMALAAYWRSLDYSCWQRLLYLATMLATSLQTERLTKASDGRSGMRRNDAPGARGSTVSLVEQGAEGLPARAQNGEESRRPDRLPDRL